MNIKLLAIGKTDNKSLQTLIDDYTKRLSFYIKFDLEIIPDIKNVKNLSESQQKEKEGELILGKLSPTDQLILLDENGKTFSSVGLSEELQKKMNFKNWFDKNHTEIHSNITHIKYLGGFYLNFTIGKKDKNTDIFYP